MSGWVTESVWPNMPRTGPQRDAFRSQRPWKAPARGNPRFFDSAAAGTPPARHDLRQIGDQNYRQVRGATGSVTDVQFQLLQGEGVAADAGDNRLWFWAAAELADPARQSRVSGSRWRYLCQRSCDRRGRLSLHA